MAETRKPLSYETHPNGISFDIRGMRVRGALYDDRRIIDVSGDEESIDRLRRGLDRLEAEAEARGYQRAIDAIEKIRDALNDTLHEDEVVDPIGCLESLLIQLNSALGNTRATSLGEPVG